MGNIIFVAFEIIVFVLMALTVVSMISKKLPVKKGVTGIIVGAIFLTMLNAVVVIPTGYSGVRSRFGQISEDPVPNGFNLKIPFVESIEEVNNKQQDITFVDRIWSETSTRTAVYAENLTVSYTIQPDKSAWLCAHVSDYKNGLIKSDLVASAFKSASKEYEDTDVTNRAIIEQATKESLQNALDQKYEKGVVEINNVTISNIDFDESYNQAIADKQNAQLAYEKQQIENQTLVEKAQAEADAEVIKAKGDAEANTAKQNSLTDEIIKNQWLEKWDGKLPDSLVGSDMDSIMVGIN